MTCLRRTGSGRERAPAPLASNSSSQLSASNPGAAAGAAVQPVALAAATASRAAAAAAAATFCYCWRPARRRMTTRRLPGPAAGPLPSATHGGPSLAPVQRPRLRAPGAATDPRPDTRTVGDSRGAARPPRWRGFEAVLCMQYQVILITICVTAVLSLWFSAVSEYSGSWILSCVTPIEEIGGFWYWVHHNAR